MPAVRRIQFIFDTAQPVQGFRNLQTAQEGLVAGADAVRRHLRDLETQQSSWSRGAREVLAAERQKTAAVLEDLKAAKQGAAATRELNDGREREAALARAGVAAETAQGRAIQGVMIARQRARAEIEATIAAQRQAAQAERVLAEARTRVQDKAENLAAIRQGTQAEYQNAAAKRARQDIQRAGLALNSAEARELTQLAQKEIALEHATERVNQAKQRMAVIGQRVRSVLSTLLPALTIAGMVALGQSAVRTGIETVTSFERIDRTLKIVTGSQAAAQAEMAFLRAESDRLGLALKTTAVSYSQFAAAAKSSLTRSEIREIFSSITGGLANLGASEAQIERALVALQQMASKGTVGMEELRQQLGDALPGAVDLFAKSMGQPLPEFYKLVEQGKVSAREIIGFAREVERTYGTGGKAIDNTQAAINRVKNAVIELRREAGAGFLGGFLGGFADLQRELSSEQMRAAARELGETIGRAARVAAEALAFLIKHLEELKAVVFALVQIKAASAIYSTVAALRAAAAAAGAAQVSVLGLNAAFLATPVGWVAVGVAALAAGTLHYTNQVKASHAEVLNQIKVTQDARVAIDLLREATEKLTDAQRSQVIGSIASLNTQRDSLRQQYSDFQRSIVTGGSMVPDEAGKLKLIITPDQLQKINDYKGAISQTEKSLRDAWDAVNAYVAANKKAEMGTAQHAASLDALGDKTKKATDNIAALVRQEVLAARQAAARSAAILHGNEALEAEIRNQEVENKLRASGIRLSEEEIRVLVSGGRVRSEWANLLAAAIRDQQNEEIALNATKDAYQRFTDAIVQSSKAMRDASEAGQAQADAIASQGKALADAVAEIRSQTAGVLSGGAASPWARLDAEVERVVNGSIKRLSTESPAEFEARWGEAAAEVRAALSGLFSAEVAAEIKQRAEEAAAYLREPIVRAMEDAKSRVLDATAEMLAHGKADWGALWEDFKVQAIRAIEEWLVRWIAAQRLAQAEAARTAAITAAASAASGKVGGGAAGGVGFNSWSTLAGNAAAANAASGAAGASSINWAAAGQYMGWAAAGAIWVKVLTGLYEGFTKGKTKWGEASLAGDFAGNSRKIIEQARKAVEEILKGVREFIAETHLSIQKLGDVRISQRGNLFTVRDAIDGVGRAFDSAQAAMDFAAVRAIQLAEYGKETSEMVRAAIQGSRAETLRDLQRDIERATTLESRGKPEIFSQIRAFVTQFWDEWKWVLDTFRNNAAQAGGALRQAGLGIVLGFQDLYNQLTGKQPDLAAQREQIAAIFNAQKKLAIAEAQLEQLRVKQQIEGLRARATIAGGHAQLDQAEIAARGQYLKARAEMAKAEITLYNQSLIALEAMYSALGEIIANLERIPDLVGRDIVLGGVGGGGGRQQAREDFDRRMVELRQGAMSDAARAVSEFTIALVEFRAAADAARASTAERAEGERLLREQLRRTIEDIIRPWTTDFGKTDFQKRFEEEKRKLDEARKASAATAPPPAAPRQPREDREGPGARGTGGVSGGKPTPSEPRAPAGPKSGQAATGGSDARERLYGGYTEAELLANPALVARLGGPAAARWGAGHPAAGGGGGGPRLGPEDADFDLANRNLFEAFKRELDASIASFQGLEGGLAGVHDHADELRKNVAALGLDATETAARLKGIDLGEAFQIQQGQMGVLSTLYGYLRGSAAHAEKVEAFEHKKVDLDIQILEKQLEVWGILNAENKALLDDARRLAHENVKGAQTTLRFAGYKDAAQTQQNAANIMEEAARRFKESTDRLVDYSRSFLTDEALTFLNPREQVEAARKQAEATAEAARAGSLEAREQFEQDVSSYLKLYRETFGGGAAGERAGGFIAESRKYFEILQELIRQTTYRVENVTYGAFTPPASVNTTPALTVYAPPASNTLPSDAATESTLRAIGTDVALFHERETSRGTRQDLLLREMRDTMADFVGKLDRLLAKVEVA